MINCEVCVHIKQVSKSVIQAGLILAERNVPDTVV